MRILSQDKTASVDESGVSLLVSENYVVAVFPIQEVGFIRLGEYKSKERAMEVLEDIHTLYEELPFSGSTVFYMPKE